MPSTLTKRQRKTFGPKFFTSQGKRYRIEATVKYDDECGNGHNTFAITGRIDRQARNGNWIDHAGGCVHNRIAKYFPQLAPYIKWHLCSSDGPMHYLTNTVYLAGDRDHNGLRKGETKQIINGVTGRPSWILERVDRKQFPQYVNADTCPKETVTLRYVPWLRVGEGKARQLDAARNAAIWPDATDEQLMAEPDELRRMLRNRLTDLLVEFRDAVESLGFVY